MKDLWKKPKRDGCDTLVYYIYTFDGVRSLKSGIVYCVFAFAANVLQHIYYATYIQDTRILQRMIHM